MGRFKHLVNSLTVMEGFKARYHIPQRVALQYCAPDQILTNRREGEVDIPIITFIKGGMTLSIGKVTRDYLINHRLCPNQHAPNLFRVLGSVDALNKLMNLGSHGTTSFTCMSAIPLPAWDFISSPGSMSLEWYHVFLSPTRA